jgi:hypothetical protein
MKIFKKESLRIDSSPCCNRYRTNHNNSCLMKTMLRIAFLFLVGISSFYFAPTLHAQPFEAQISQLCDDQSPNEATIMYVTADGAPSGSWLLRTFNNPAQVWAPGANGSLQEATGLPPGTTIEIVDGNNIIGSAVATITNLSGGGTFFTTTDDDGVPASMEGVNDFGCQNEEACPAGSAFDLIANWVCRKLFCRQPRGDSRC